jgi:hypothetical protein
MWKPVPRKDFLEDLARAHPSLFKDVFEGMLNDNPLIRMRSADVIEKVSQKHPKYLQPFKHRLINEVSNARAQFRLEKP